MNKSKTVFITGITGQDGAYLSKLLLNERYKVIGCIRDNDNFSKLEYLKIKDQLILVKCNLLNFSDIKKKFEEYNPDEVYNFAAQSSVTLSLKNPFDTLNFNIMSVVNLLEAIRLVNSKIKFFQASSCEMFGNVKKLPANEQTFFKPLNPYAVSKVSAHLIVTNYRKVLNLFSCCGILFNHESFLRGEDFFVKKIIKQAVEIKDGRRDFLKVGNIDVKRDFGYAPSYVKAMWSVMQLDNPDDFVFSSGSSVCLRDIIYYVFDKLNIDREKVIEDNILFRASDIKETLGDSSKLKKVLDWDYKMSFYDVLDLLIEEELKSS